MKMWRAVVSGVTDRRHLIRVTNRFFNDIAYRSDEDAYSQSEYWAAPSEFLFNGGDCEDFAIAKYVALRALGVLDSEMRLVVGRDTDKQRNHAVLIVASSGEQYVLDSATSDVYLHRKSGLFRPLLSFNLTAAWRHLPSPVGQEREIQVVHSWPDLVFRPAEQ
jgi:predicted transglutaminase-like cysteine proteinase